MNLKVLVASLVLGSSSIVMASPGVTATTTTTIVRDHRGGDQPVVQPILVTRPVITHPIYVNPPVAQPVRVGWNGGGHRLPPVYRPVTLASGLSFANNGRMAIDVGSQQGRFATLQITAAGGRTFIRQVTVQFDDGQTQVMRNLDRTLTGNEGMTLDLAGGRRNIRRVVVVGNELNNGWRSERGAFTVTAS
jgi:hypothetical protein